MKVVYPYNLLFELYGDKCCCTASFIDNVEKAIDGLKDRERCVLLSYYRDGKTVKECALLINASNKTVRELLSKAIRCLKMNRNLRRLEIKITNSTKG